MEYNNLLELIKTVSESNISGFQYEEGDTKIIITTGGNGLPDCMTSAAREAGASGARSADFIAAEAPVSSAQNSMGAQAPGAVQSFAQNSAAVQSFTAAQPVTENKLPVGNIVKSPLVGTFYAAPAEDAEPFVKVGDMVKKGQTLAIVEAMKLMNDIEAEYEGTILEIFVENGATVEYGQPLFSIG